MAEMQGPDSAIARFPVEDGSITVGGTPLPILAERAGQTPFFAYDRRLIADRVAMLRSVLPDRVALHYAIKANPMPAVVQHLSGLVDGFDVASGQEMKTALDTTMPADRIGFAGPGKTNLELSQAIAAGVVVEMESTGEMARIGAVADAAGVRPRVAIRVNPDFEVKGSSMRMGGGSSQFGVDAEDVPAMLSDLAALDLEFVGFHIFAGSQNLNADLLAETQRLTVELALRLAEHASNPMEHLNIGGGFGIPYFPKDRSLDLETIGKRLGELLHGSMGQALGDARVVIELGRYIVGEAGVYVSRIVDRKVSRGRVFLITDGGLHHQLAASGNFGQTIRRNYPVAIGNRMGGPNQTVSVVGCLCTPLDLLADNVELPAAEIGDLVVVFQSGAYGLTASPTAFLGHPAPIELLI